MYIAILISGFGGGAARGLIGFLKHQYSYKNTGFDLRHFLSMMFVSGAIGLLVACAVNESGLNLEGVEYISPALAFIIGYGGGDFLEGIYKILSEKLK